MKLKSLMPYAYPFFKKFILLPSWQELVDLKHAYRHEVIVGGHKESEVRVALAEPSPVVSEELKKSFKRKKVNFYLANPFEVERWNFYR